MNHKIETDAGLVGYGETDVNSKIARDQIEHLDWALQRARGGFERLIGGDPMSIEQHYYRMTQMHYPLPAPMISGIMNFQIINYTYISYEKHQ